MKKLSIAANFLAYAAGPFLVAYLLLLLGTTYISQQDLREASANALRFNLEKRASALSYFHSERTNDISTLAKDRALDVFFSNRALGMSMEYGLRSSLLSMQKTFQGLVDSKQIDFASIYLRLLFYDQKGERLVDVGTTAGTPEHWFERDVLAAEGARTIIFQDEGHSHLVLFYPYHYKQRFMGTIVAEVNLSKVVRQLIQPKVPGHLRYVVLARSSKHIVRKENADKKEFASGRVYFDSLPLYFG